MEYGYLVVEGQHEIEFIGKLLKRKGLRRIVKVGSLDPFWTKLIPKSFPYGGDLNKRMPVPVFFQNDVYSIAIHSAIGEDQISTTINSTIANVDSIPEKLNGIGIVIDADYNNDGGIAKFKRIKNEIGLSLKVPNQPGDILNGNTNSGIFILPNNNDNGTLENILISCAELVYPNLFDLSSNLVKNVDRDQLEHNDKKDFLKPSGRNKAIIGCIGNVLRPGKAIQVSIQDNKWINDNTIEIGNIKLFCKFLYNLLKIDD
jgi:hypothetical protein